MKFETLAKIAVALGHTIREMPEEDTVEGGKAYSINEGELEIWEIPDKKVTIKTIGGDRETDRNVFQLIGFKHYPATRDEPEDFADYVIGEYDGLSAAFRQACIFLATQEINNVSEGESMAEIFEEEEEFYWHFWFLV